MISKIDRTDRRILGHLQKNGRLSNAELSVLMNVSPATCDRRTQRLFEEGYIDAVRAHISRKKAERGA